MLAQRLWDFKIGSSPNGLPSEPAVVAQQEDAQDKRRRYHQGGEEDDAHACAQGLGHHGDDGAGHGIEDQVFGEHTLALFQSFWSPRERYIFQGNSFCWMTGELSFFFLTFPYNEIKGNIY